MEILKGLKTKYEAHHKCFYTEEAIKEAVILSDRYIAGRFLPDKAIDIIDEAGAKARISVMHQPGELMQFSKEIEEMRSAKEGAISNQDYETAAKLRDQEKQIRDRLEQSKEEWERNKDEQKVIVDVEEVAAIVAKQTGIPVTRLTEAETSKILKMGETLNQEIVGQADAIDIVSRALRRSRADIKDPNRPIGAFLFLGPTGVGKTLLARTLAIHLFGGEDALIQVDMSEYMEKFAVSRMTGSPPGYVGYEEGGQLTERVRQRPYSVVLFDEVEKAHPDVMNILLQILEEGRLTDSLGRKIDFRNTIIVMTSNLGSDLIRKSTEMGFGVTSGQIDYDSMKDKIDKAVKKHFKPEFINRLDGVVIFRAFDKPQLIQVIELEVAKLQKRLLRKNLFLKLDPESKDFLVNKGYQAEMGARPLRRAVEQYIEDPLAEMLLREPLISATFLVHVKDDKLAFEREPEEEEEGALASASTGEEKKDDENP